MKEPINPNYCASIVKVDHFVPIEKADNIQHALIFNNSVIVGKEILPGTIGIYFPIECQISSDFLKHHNLYRKKESNLDAGKPGFFEHNGRVRAVRLRGAKSEGFFIPIDSLHEKYNELKEYPINTDFDWFETSWLCRKYVIKEPQERKPRQGRAVDNRQDRLIDNQFHFHVDTLHAKKSFSNIVDPEDIIWISDKKHGTSGCWSNIMVKKQPLKWYERLLEAIKVKIVNTEYDYIYSSRKVIKNKYLNPNGDGFYGSDIWGYWNENIKHLIPKGVTIYGEIVGYVPGTDKLIQPNYPYGCVVGESKLYVYRMTMTNPDGVVFEFSWQQIKDFCKKYGLTHAPEFYYGYAKDLYNLNTDEHWHQEMIHKMMNDFNLEQDCPYNKGQPAEGIIIRPERLFDCVPLKLKSFRFTQWETDLLDKGISDTETEESA